MAEPAASFEKLRLSILSFNRAKIDAPLEDGAEWERPEWRLRADSDTFSNHLSDLTNDAVDALRAAHAAGLAWAREVTPSEALLTDHGLRDGDVYDDVFF